MSIQRTYLLGLFTVCCLLCNAIAYAQTGKITADRDKVLVGEQVNITYQITTPQPVTQWQMPGDKFNTLEVVQTSPLDSAKDGSNFTYRQQFTITGFDSGSWVVPAIVYHIQKKRYKTDSLLVTIVPPQLQDSTYHSVTEIIAVEAPPINWMKWIMGVLVTLIIIGLFIYLIKKKKTVPPTQKNIEGSSLQQTLQKLEALEASAHFKQKNWIPFYSELVNIHKGFITHKTDEPTHSATTDDLLVLLHKKIQPETVAQTAEIHRMADVVKFAQYKPEAKQAKAHVDLMKTLVQQMNSLNTEVSA